MTGSAKTRHNGAFFKFFIVNIYNLLSQVCALAKFQPRMATPDLMELQHYKVATTERSICTASIVNDNGGITRNGVTVLIERFVIFLFVSPK